MPRSRTCRAAFSLIEIILALGIISFALVGILGLFPVAVDAAANSQRETQAALIAHSIFDQLNAMPDSSKRSVILGEDYTSTSPTPITVDLTQPTTSATIGFDSNGKPLASSSDPTTAYTAQIIVTPIASPAYETSKVLVVVRPFGSKTVSYPFASIFQQKRAQYP